MKLTSLFNQILYESPKSIIDEVSDEVYDLVKTKYSNARIVMDSISEKKVDRLKLKDTTQVNYGSKPVGLWYAFGTDWVDWVRDEMPQWERDNLYLLEVNIDKILIIDTPKKLKQFNNVFAVKDDYGFNVNWGEVDKKYSGIEIRPYQYNFRYEYNWYYGWDIASGCIWDNDALKSIKKI